MGKATTRRFLTRLLRTGRASHHDRMAPSTSPRCFSSSLCGTSASRVLCGGVGRLAWGKTGRASGANGGHVFARARRTYPDLPQVTVGVVVLNRSMEALFVERKNEPAANTFAFPGGRLDLGETMEACARREVKEETNIDLDPSFPLQHVTTIEHMNYDEEDRIRYHYIIIEYVGLASESSEAIPGDDAASIAWS